MVAETWSARSLENDFLDDMRRQGDRGHEADEVVSELYAQGRDQLNALMAKIRTNEELLPEDVPQVAKDYFAKCSPLPEWVDRSKIQLAEGLFEKYGFIASTLLACASLPECYVMRNGIHVLAATDKLAKYAQRRVLETAQMIMDIMRKGGLTDPQGRGVPAVLKVRLLHASIRHLIVAEARSGVGPPQTFFEVLESMEWDEQKQRDLGTPINQEDMAYTLMTFSHVSLQGLKAFGAPVTRQEAEAFIHCWNVVGYLLGIREALLPPTPEDAQKLFDTIKGRQAGPTEEGKAMQRALLKLLESLAGKAAARAPSWLIPSWVPHDLPIYVTQYCLDNIDEFRPATTQMLGVPQIKWWRQLSFFVLGVVLHRAVSATGRELAGTRLGRAAQVLHWGFLERMATMTDSEDKRLFNLPDHLDPNFMDLRPAKTD